MGYPEGNGKLVKLGSDELNQPTDGFGFLVDTENGLLKNIYRCYYYAGCINFFPGGDNMPKIEVSWNLIRKMRKVNSLPE